MSTDDARKPPADDTSVFYLGQSLVTMAVCVPASMDGDQVSASVTSASPPGTEAGLWAVAGEVDGGNPIPCPDDPDGRRHWLLNC